MPKSKIDWLNQPGYRPETWNLTAGCKEASAGCDNCWARGMARRLAGQSFSPRTFVSGRKKYYRGLLDEGKWTGQVVPIPEALDDPSRWRSPRCVFVNSMSDLFHEKVPMQLITDVIDTIIKHPQHRFIVLTKRPARATQIFSAMDLLHEEAIPNLWFGISVEGQATYRERAAVISDIPATVRFISHEPGLGPLTIDDPQLYDNSSFELGVDWVITGGESGAKDKVRPYHLEWAQALVEECEGLGIPLFVKQLGRRPVHRGQAMVLRDPKGADPGEWPGSVRVRQFPTERGTRNEERGTADCRWNLPDWLSDMCDVAAEEIDCREDFNRAIMAEKAFVTVQEPDGVDRDFCESVIALGGLLIDEVESLRERLSSQVVYSNALQERIDTLNSPPSKRTANERRGKPRERTIARGTI